MVPVVLLATPPPFVGVLVQKLERFLAEHATQYSPFEIEPMPQLKVALFS